MRGNQGHALGLLGTCSSALEIVRDTPGGEIGIQMRCSYLSQRKSTRLTLCLDRSHQLRDYSQSACTWKSFKKGHMLHKQMRGKIQQFWGSKLERGQVEVHQVCQRTLLQRGDASRGSSTESARVTLLQGGDAPTQGGGYRTPFAALCAS